MCGFFAVIGDISPDEAARLAADGEAIQRHRGPDGAGHRLLKLGNGKSALLGHQRLSIIDLSDSGNQPMDSQSGQTTLVFNGEIYNYLELANQFRLNLRSASDTEVLLELVEQRGLRQSLELANGMWGLCTVQSKDSIVEFARDRAGKKPLYYWSGRGLLIVASELKTVAKLAGRRFRVNHAILRDYVDYAVQDASEESWLVGVKTLPAGSVGRVAWSDSDPYLDWELMWDPSVEEVPQTFDDAAQNLRELFEDSIKLRLRADVPVAVTLSGGLDSSLIAAAMTRRLGDPKQVQAISAVSPGSVSDESAHIDRASSALGITSHKVNLNLQPEESFALMEKVTWHNDAPLGSFSNIAFYRLMECARANGVKVVLSGQGADEMFCGYRKYYFWALRENLKRRNILRFGGNVIGSMVSRTSLAQFSFGEALRYLPSSIGKAKSVLSPSLSPSTLKHDLGMRQLSVAGRQYLDLKQFSVPYLTHYEDRASMAHGVEVRLPFLDFRIMELALGTSLDFKVRNGWTKYIMRKAFNDYLPKDILWRRDKQGFSNPQEQWLKGPLRDEIGQLFDGEAKMFDLGLVDRTEIKAAWTRFLAGDRTTTHRQMFSVWALEIWLKSFADFIES